MQQLKIKTEPRPQPAAFTRCPDCGGMCNVFEGNIHCRRVDTCGWTEGNKTEVEQWNNLTNNAD